MQTLLEDHPLSPPAPQDDLRALVRMCLAGDGAAQSQLIARYHGQVFGLCLRMLGHRQDAEDVAQEVFYRVLRSLHRWDPNREFTPWLLAIAGNRCRTFLGQRARRGEALPQAEQVADRTPPSPAPLVEEVQLALGQLRAEYRLAFLLFHEQQFEYATIAETIGAPVGTIKTWIHRARKQLAEILVRRGVVSPAVGAGSQG